MQAQTIKKQFESLDFSKLPKEVKDEAIEIRDNTDNFSDQDLVDVFAENWTLLYDDVIKKQHPSAIQDEASQAPAAPKKPKPEGSGKVQPKDIEVDSQFLAPGTILYVNRYLNGEITAMNRAQEVTESFSEGFRSKMLYGRLEGTSVLTEWPEHPNLMVFEEGFAIKRFGEISIFGFKELSKNEISNMVEKLMDYIKKTKNSPKKKPAPEKSPKVKKKAPAKKKRTTKTPAIRKKDLMRHFDEELRIVKRFYNMLNKQVDRKRWVSLHRFVQKAIVDKRAHPNSKLADLVNTVAEKAEKVADNNMDPVTVNLGDEKLAQRIQELAKDTAVYPSVRLFKRYIGLSGERASDEKIERLIAAIDKALASKKVKKSDPFAKELEEVLKALKKARNNGRVDAINVGLGAPTGQLAGTLDYALGKK